MIILDIETVPRTDLYPKYPEWFKECRLFPAPKMGNLKDPEKIKAKQEAWETEGGAVKELSTNIFTAEPVVLGMKIKTDSKSDCCVVSIKDVICENLISWIDSSLPLITFNGKLFDIPVLMLYFAKSNEKGKYIFLERFLTSNYDRALHIDLYRLFPDCPDLITLARLLEIKTEKFGKGSNIYNWYKDGEIELIKQHCKQDLEITYQIAKKLGF